jgi:hypothetical protein
MIFTDMPIEDDELIPYILSSLALLEQGLKPARRYIFTDGFDYQPPVLFLVAVP